MHSPVNFRHARLLNYLHHLMDLYGQQKRIGEVHREVIAVRLSTRNVFLPDLKTKATLTCVPERKRQADSEAKGYSLHF